MEEEIQSTIERILRERVEARETLAALRAEERHQEEVHRQNELRRARQEAEEYRELEEKTRLIIKKFLAIMNSAGNPGTVIFETPTSRARMRGWIVARRLLVSTQYSPGRGDYEHENLDYLALMTDGRLFWERNKTVGVERLLGYWPTSGSYQLGRTPEAQYGADGTYWEVVFKYLLEVLPEGIARVLADCGLNWDRERPKQRDALLYWIGEDPKLPHKRPK